MPSADRWVTWLWTYLSVWHWMLAHQLNGGNSILCIRKGQHNNVSLAALKMPQRTKPEVVSRGPWTCHCCVLQSVLLETNTMDASRLYLCGIPAWKGQENSNNFTNETLEEDGGRGILEKHSAEAFTRTENNWNLNSWAESPLYCVLGLDGGRQEAAKVCAWMCVWFIVPRWAQTHPGN